MNKNKKLKVYSFGKFQAILGLLSGFVLGIIYAFGGLIVDTLVTLNWVSSSETAGLSYGTVLAFGALLGMPLIGFTAGFVFGILSALLFNLVAKYFFGLSLNFEKDTDR